MFFCRSLSAILVSLALYAPSLLSAENSIGPKAEVFGGYSGYRAGGTVNGVKVPDFTDGWAGQLIVRTGNWTGLVVDVNGHYNSSAKAHDFAVGPRFQLPVGHFFPFAEALLGVQHFNPKGFPSQNTPTYIFGAGIDVRISDRFSVRPFQISYVSTNYTATSGGLQSNYFNGVRVQSGLIYHFGQPAPEGEVSAACSTSPSSVDAGVPVKFNVTPKGFVPKRILRYNYASTGGKVEGTSATASVDTAGVESGSYTISANVEDSGKGKHHQKASCQATFAINAKATPPAQAAQEPNAVPASPTQEAAAAAVPAQTAAEPNAATPMQAAKAEAVPVPAPADKASSAIDAPGNTTARVEAALPLRANKFGSIAFLHDTRRPTRVDNTAKAELDRYADALAASPDASGVVVGYATDKERAVKAGDKEAPNAAALRAVNTKNYLSKDKGIDPARIKPRAGCGRKAVKLWVVPAGATFPGAGTEAVNEAKVKAVPRVALKAKNTAHKKRVKR